MDTEIVDWLLAGDVAIQYQVYRDLLDEERPDLRARIATEGWGARFLSRRRPDGHWGRAFYQPKWTSTHYTLLDLRNLGLPPDNAACRESVAIILRDHRAADGGISPSSTVSWSDVCINGMFLNYACYFGAEEAGLVSIVDYLVREHMPDGGFNCQSNRGGAVHSSLHSTISVLEGLLEYRRQGYGYRLAEVGEMEAAAREFILRHRLFRSDHTGEIINPRMVLLSHPPRWYFDILRGLDYFQDAGMAYDPRLDDALQVLARKRRKDGRWPVQGKKPGQVHFEMEGAGEPSRWNTLRALRVLRRYGT